MNIKDNDSLAAHLAAEVQADLLILMSNVDGIYSLPPGQDGARLLHSYCPSLDGNVTYGQKSNVGLGGMESKVLYHLTNKLNVATEELFSCYNINYFFFMINA